MSNDGETVSSQQLNSVLKESNKVNIMNEGASISGTNKKNIKVISNVPVPAKQRVQTVYMKSELCFCYSTF